MTARYIVLATPYGLTFDPDFNANWSVIDRAPVVEDYETKMGTVVAETKAPPTRIVAWCRKKSHAELIAAALNGPGVVLSFQRRQVDEEMLANALRVASSTGDK